MMIFYINSSIGRHLRNRIVQKYIFSIYAVKKILIKKYLILVCFSTSSLVNMNQSYKWNVVFDWLNYPQISCQCVSSIKLILFFYIIESILKDFWFNFFYRIVSRSHSLLMEVKSCLQVNGKRCKKVCIKSTRMLLGQNFVFSLRV